MYAKLGGQLYCFFPLSLRFSILLISFNFFPRMTGFTHDMMHAEITLFSPFQLYGVVFTIPSSILLAPPVHLLPLQMWFLWTSKGAG